jgi:hypothetical protein
MTLVVQFGGLIVLHHGLTRFEFCVFDSFRVGSGLSSCFKKHGTIKLAALKPIAMFGKLKCCCMILLPISCIGRRQYKYDKEGDEGLARAIAGDNSPLRSQVVDSKAVELILGDHHFLRLRLRLLSPQQASGHLEPLIFL